MNYEQETTSLCGEDFTPGWKVGTPNHAKLKLTNRGLVVCSLSTEQYVYEDQ